jgi:hypothetical protein
MNAAQALLRQVLFDPASVDLDADLLSAITEELERANDAATPPDRTDPGPRILPITAYRAARPTPPDPRLRGLRFDAEEA